MPAAMARFSLSCLADGGMDVNWKHSVYEEFWVHKTFCQRLPRSFLVIYGISVDIYMCQRSGPYAHCLDTQKWNCKGILGVPFASKLVWQLHNQLD